MKIINGRSPFAITKNLILDGDCQLNAAVNGVVTNLDNVPINELVYDPVSWVEWIMNGAVGDSTGIEITTVSGAGKSIRLDTNLKGSTKYGLMYAVVSQNLDQYIYGSNWLTGADLSLEKTVGNHKLIIVTQAAIVTNALNVATSSNNTTGRKIKFRDFRTFELPAGSQAEWDFDNLTADQLNVLYPF